MPRAPLRLIVASAVVVVLSALIPVLVVVGDDGASALAAAIVGAVALLVVQGTLVVQVLRSRARTEPVSVHTGSKTVDRLVEHAADVILIVDDDRRIRYSSPSARDLLGTTTLQGLPVTELVEPGDRGIAEYMLEHAHNHGSPGARSDWTMRAADGRAARVEVTCRDLRADESVNGVVLTLRDVTAQRHLEHELTRQLYHDPLTSLPNGLLLRDRINQAIAADVGLTVLLLLNLDKFRSVNEVLGRAVGDTVLVGVADRLREEAGAGAVVARLGGDEFAILLPSVPSLAAADAVGARITAAVAEPRPDTAVCTASVGLATTGPADDEASLIRNAEHALSVAKAAGGNQWRRFEVAMADAVRYRTELRGALGQALRDGALVVEYQPIVRLADGKTLGFEALVRWQHPTRGLLSPSEFIDIAEDSGLITPIGEYVLRVATAAASTWGTSCFVTVNVSARQFRSRGFVGGVLAQLREVGLAPSRLVIEITESLLLRDDDEVWEDLNRLRQAGVRVAIDDFGTGYSSLGYLRQVPLDIVKLDRLFISTMASSDRQRDLVCGIVDLIRTLNLEVVAEGIETVPQRRLVAGIGCEYGQGFLFARPMSEVDVQRWLARRSPELAAAHRGSP